MLPPQIADTDTAFVDFFVDDVRKATVTSAPFTMVLTLDKVGLIHLKAIAQDKMGNRGISAFLDLDVKADAPPQVAITSPADGSTVATGATLTVNVQATDDLFAREITLTANGELVATQTRSNSFGKSFATSFTFTVPTNITLGGTITLTATAKDSGGNLSTVAMKTIALLDSIAPTVTALTSPGQTALYKPGETGSATVTVTDNVGLTSITCSTVGATGGNNTFTFTPPLVSASRTFTFVTPVDAVSNAPIQLICSAVDAAGNSANKSITLQVADVVAPQTTITSPAEGSTVNTGATLTVTVVGTDDLAVKEITLVASGEVVATQTKTNTSGKSFTASFILAVPATITQGGSIQLAATVKDTAGNVSQTLLRTVTVRDGIAPVVTALTSPGQTILYKPGETGSATVVASDNMGVTSITCAATGASTTSQVIPISPAQTQATQEFVFQVAANAGPYAVIGITCTAVDSAGNQGNKNLNLTVADVVPPQVTWTLPANNASSLLVNASVTVTFDEALAAGTVNAASVGLATAAGGQGVTGTVTLAVDRKSVTFKPTASLVAGSAYVLTVGTTVTDDAGNALVAPYLLNFTTDGAPPAVASVSPATGSLNVPVGSAVSVTFAEKIDPASVTADMVSLTSISGQVPSAVTVSSDALSVTFKPYNQLGYSRLYTFTLKAGVRDISGNATTGDLTATFTTQSTSSDLVGYWPMDGDWTDYSGNGNHGTAYGGAAFSSDKVVGTQAGSFDGVNDYVEVQDAQNLSISDNLTIEAWINPNTELNGYATHVINKWGAGDTNQANYVLYYFGTTSGINRDIGFYANAGGTWKAISARYTTTLNTWYHVALTYNSTTGGTLYINGVAQGAPVGSGALKTNNYTLRFGATSPNYFKGLVDEVSIFKRFLPSEDIFEHYNAGLSADRTPPITPTVDPVASPVYSNQIVLRGTKDAGSSIRVNGKQIVAHDVNTIWQAVYTLALGQNLLDVSSHDLAGNVSPAVNLVVDLLPANPSDPVPSKPVVTLVSPGQTVKYKPGETGTATVTATNPDGIAKLTCIASGAVSEGTLVNSFDPSLAEVTRQFAFQVASDAVPYAPYKLSCIAETVAGAFGISTLDLQVADVVPATVTGSSIANNATGVIATLPISITFNEAMLAASITNDTVQMRRVDTGAVVAGASVLSADGKALTFTPAAALDCSTSYQFAIHGVSDLGGNGIDYNIDFSTQALVDLLIENKGTSAAPFPVTSGRYGNVTIKNSCVVFVGSVAANAVSLTNSSTLTHNATGVTGAEKLDFTVSGTLSIDSTSKIDVSSKGYLGGWQGSNNVVTGRTNGNTTAGGSGLYNGSSYGGTGGVSYNGGTVNASYGTIQSPNEVGSGGGGYDNNYIGYLSGNGGGFVKITAGTLALSGSILADGGGTTGRSGGGSGGGVMLNVGTLSGTGMIYARGGSAGTNYNTDLGSGGGGRIAIYYDTNTLPTANILASGGKTYDGSVAARNGGAGTIYLKDNAKSKADLIINNNGISTARSTSIPGGDYGSVTAKGGVVVDMSGSLTTENDLVLTDSQITVSGSLSSSNLSMIKSTLTLKGALQVVNNVSLASNSILSQYSTGLTGSERLDLTVAGMFSIDSTSKIDISSKGYLGGWQGSNNVVTGRTNGNTTVGGSGLYNGASYGGTGGVSYNGGTVNASYGTIQSPNEVGSGGGGYDNNYIGYLSGNGGGFVKITAGTLALSGSILADGGGTTGRSGGGSGGGVMLNVGTLSGTGTIYARGGSAGTNYNTDLGSGGGGRIAIYYDTNTLPTANILASGGKTYNGSNSARNGGAGTVYLKNNANIKADLIINNNGIATTRATPVPGGDYRIYDVIGGAVVSASGPITSENETLIKDTQLSFSGDYEVPRNLTLLNSTVTVTGAVTVPGNLLMTNSTMSVRNNLNVTGTITAQTGSILTHEAATSSTQYGLDIKAAGVTIDSTSRIDVKGKGYLGGLQGDNGSDTGRTTGNSVDGGSAAGNGGSLGGIGGNVAGLTTASYGSVINPAELGSGGGGDLVTPASGGNGGGFVKVTAPTLTMNGSIIADGMDSSSGAGSGGSIRLDVTTISGNGSLSARGGNGGSAGAGGGRIALYYTSSTLPPANINASGGRGGDGSVITRNGGAGTVYLKQSTKVYADLLIDNRGLDSAAGSTPLKAAGKGTITVITGSSLMQGNTLWPASMLKGYWINPNISQTSFFKILDNSTDTIFINSADGNLNSVAVVGDSFSGVFAMNSLSVLGKAHLYTDEQFNVAGDAAIDDATVVAGELHAGRTLLTNGGVYSRPVTP